MRRSENTRGPLSRCLSTLPHSHSHSPTNSSLCRSSACVIAGNYCWLAGLSTISYHTCTRRRDKDVIALGRSLTLIADFSYIRNRRKYLLLMRIYIRKISIDLCLSYKKLKNKPLPGSGIFTKNKSHRAASTVGMILNSCQ